MIFTKRNSLQFFKEFVVFGVTNLNYELFTMTCLMEIASYENWKFASLFFAFAILRFYFKKSSFLARTVTDLQLKLFVSFTTLWQFVFGSVCLPPFLPRRNSEICFSTFNEILVVWSDLVKLIEEWPCSPKPRWPFICQFFGK